MFTPIEDIAKKEAELNISEPVVTVENSPVTVEKTTVSNGWAAFDSEPEQVKEYVTFCSGDEEDSPKPVDTKNIDIEAVKSACQAAEEGFRYLNAKAFEKREEPVVETVQPAVEQVKAELPEIKVIGEAFGLYVIVETEGKLVMIDKHAAHERIIFERLKSRNCRQYSQQLLVGIKLLLTGEEIDALENNTQLLEDMGFAFDFSEKPYITATALPTFLMECDAEGIICEVAENLRSHKLNPQSSYLDNVLHNMACKAAIKANDKNSPQEMKALAEQVFADEKIRHCPHGRPVMFTMTKANIDHQFKRT
jgi:DNA mismatch repair protein MutL